MSSTTAALLFLHAETPLHPGTGSALGAIDLPIARERHTGWPLIPGSSMKGVLRDRCLDKLANGNEKDTQLWAAFGPDTENASLHAGALSITDMRLLAFPVRSLRGLFAWATCPAALDRLVRDARMAGQKDIERLAKAVLDKCKVTADRVAFVSAGDLLTTAQSTGEDSNMVLEEFDYKAGASPELKNLGEALDLLFGDGTRLATHLALVSDNVFTHYTRFATEVMARIGLDSKTKTVKKGALFYEEFLPASSILYSVVISGGTQASTDGSAPLAYLASVLKSGDNLIQVGANATIGKGLCQATLKGGA